MRKKTILIVVVAIQAMLLLAYFVNPNRLRTSRIVVQATKFQHSQQLSSQHITAFGQDSLGIMWIGTADGLNVFNGSGGFIQLYHDESDSATIGDNYIQCIHRDLHGTMWVGTKTGVACYTGPFRFHSFTIPGSNIGIVQVTDAPDSSVIVNNGTSAYRIEDYKVSKLFTFPKSSFNNRIYSDPQGGFYAITANHFCHCDKNGRLLGKEYYTQANLLYTYHHGDSIWFSQGQRLTGLNLRTGHIFMQQNLDILPTTLYYHPDNRIYINSGYHGLYVLNPSTSEMTKVKDTELFLNHKDVTISTLFEDADHNSWIGYQNGGFQVMPNLHGYSDYPLAKDTRGTSVTCINAVGGNIIGGLEDGFFCYNRAARQTNTYRYYDIFNDSPVYRQDLTDIIPYDNSHAWLITQVRIFSASLEGGKVKIMKRAFGHENLGPLLGTGVRIGNRVLVTSNSPYLISCAFGSDRPDSIKVNNPRYDENARLLRLADGRVLIVMRSMQTAVYDPRRNRVLPLQLANADSLTNYTPSSLLQDSRHRIWIGTPHNGLFRLDMKQRRLVPDDIVPKADVETIVEGRKGELWISTKTDILMYAPDTKHMVYSSHNVATDNRENAIISSCCMTDSNIVYATTDGCRLLPRHQGENKKEPHLVVTGIRILNSDGTWKLVNEGIPNGAHYTFSSHDNDVYIAFNNANYGNRRRLLYQTWLEGYNDWQLPTLKTKVQYTDLKPGRYKFHVKTLQSPGQAPLSEFSVSLTILPPLWASAAAIFFYIMCALALLWYANTLYLRQRTDRLELKQAQAERERDRRTNEMNMNFFANISHEFRNPLTMIAGPLMVLRDDKSLPAAVHHTIDIVCKSVNRMLRLIDQMLDFNKLETDALRLRVARGDIASELKQQARVFAESARLRGITVETDGLDGNVYGLIDRDKLEKIMSNLLTNALKHVPDNGTIRIAMTCGKNDADKKMTNHLKDYCGGFVSVKVFNNGPQIEPDKLQYVFMRYYQAHDAESQHQYGWGTGIGLYYVRRQVMLHHGDIWVVNEPGGGVTFQFVLPIDEAAYTADEHVSRDEGIMQIPTDGYNDTDTRVDNNRQTVNATAKLPVMMIVDDDTDVAQYIRSIFTDDYVVVNKYSAESALADIFEVQPDIILSDVVMGETCGYELCSKIKGDIGTSHIPVVLITAKSTVGEQVEGLGVGADAYVTKPFDPRYLKALVRNQLDRKARIHKMLSEGDPADMPKEGLSEQDRKFMDELYALMEKHIAEQTLSVPAISHELMISHSKFNYKLKELTGETPGSFFRKFKLNRAAKLLREGKYNVSEVAMMTGFGTVSYFSVAFKKQFGMSPSEYR